MFNIEATFELQKIKATSNDGREWAVVIEFDGEPSGPLKMTDQQLSYLLQFNLHPDGEPEGHEKMREAIEPLFIDIPRHMWPIP